MAAAIGSVSGDVGGGESAGGDGSSDEIDHTVGININGNLQFTVMAKRRYANAAEDELSCTGKPDAIQATAAQETKRQRKAQYRNGTSDEA
ncbi:hypothetical protein GN958_ATG03143 [Phytophthora infestans]|uniref:Uncharacterized protein n=1 Tax=Phytophthora infestans TaxID=4787 RepID=A0A8S9VB61_PHYIN|nr:hypothetical protein GN958_ATG03143 [Phytophthora infestans]